MSYILALLILVKIFVNLVKPLTVKVILKSIKVKSSPGWPLSI